MEIFHKHMARECVRIREPNREGELANIFDTFIEYTCLFHKIGDDGCGSVLDGLKESIHLLAKPPRDMTKDTTKDHILHVLAFMSDLSNVLSDGPGRRTDLLWKRSLIKEQEGIGGFVDDKPFAPGMISSDENHFIRQPWTLIVKTGLHRTLFTPRFAATIERHYRDTVHAIDDSPSAAIHRPTP